MLKLDEIRYIQGLIKKRLQDSISSAEEDDLKKWAATSPGRLEFLENLLDQNQLHEKLKQFDALDQQNIWEDPKLWEAIITTELTKNRAKPPVRWIKYAAAIVLLMVAALAVYYLNPSEAGFSENPQRAVLEVVAPGGNKAILTLADGREIVLDSTHKGVLAHQRSTEIRKDSEGQLVYDANVASEPGVAPMMNVITTPRGGQYKVVLPDGSRVWLNSESSLTFPAAFSGNERKVQMTGECYFEVQHDQSRPFYVTINEQMEVEVLGTSFNITAYREENAVAATLLNGAVHVKGFMQNDTGSPHTRLIPGQQAQLIITGAKAGFMRVKELQEPRRVIAWKEGLFSFRNATVTEVMRQLSRWYDLDVHYEGAVSPVRITGEAPRNLNLLDLIELLELSNIKMEIHDKKIIIQN